jgi:hypothetical protein
VLIPLVVCGIGLLVGVAATSLIRRWLQQQRELQRRARIALVQHAAGRRLDQLVAAARRELLDEARRHRH